MKRTSLATSLIALCGAVWFDRVLRALSGGVIREPDVQLAIAVRLHRGEHDLIDDDAARTARDAAARMAAGAVEIVLPLHGPAYRVQPTTFTNRFPSLVNRCTTGRDPPPPAKPRAAKVSATS